MFQSTPPRGGRHSTSAIWRAAPSFNPRPRAGGDPRREDPDHVEGVSIHAPARGATDARGAPGADAPVSIHAPARGATPRVRQGPGDCPVSIHAPARGATTVLSRMIHGPEFQSTPPRGGRPRPGADPPPAESFNPRPRAGGDTGHPARRADAGVSIHAPARGATAVGPGDRHGQQFQSTPPRGGRRSGLTGSSRSSRFQSTPPRGGDTCIALTRSRCAGFNPRPRAGGDSSCARGRRTARSFNPRPRAGGDSWLLTSLPHACKGRAAAKGGGGGGVDGRAWRGGGVNAILGRGL